MNSESRAIGECMHGHPVWRYYHQEAPMVNALDFDGWYYETSCQSCRSECGHERCCELRRRYRWAMTKKDTGLRGR